MRSKTMSMGKLEKTPHILSNLEVWAISPKSSIYDVSWNENILRASTLEQKATKICL